MKKGYGVERVHLYITFGYWQFTMKSFLKGLVDLSWHGKKGKMLLLTNNTLTGRKQTVGKMVSCHDSEHVGVFQGYLCAQHKWQFCWFFWKKNSVNFKLNWLPWVSRVPYDTESFAIKCQLKSSVDKHKVTHIQKNSTK